jgi:hypothetical protein
MSENSGHCGSEAGNNRHSGSADISQANAFLDGLQIACKKFFTPQKVAGRFKG